MNTAALYERRRQNLTTAVSNKVIILANGLPRLRNTIASSYPFRSNSHCMYFFGRLPSGAIGILYNDEVALFLEDKDEHDSVWHGRSETKDEIGVRTGVKRIYNLSELMTVLSQYDMDEAIAIPTLDPVTNAGLRAILERSINLEGPDAVLAEAIIEQRLTHDEFAIDEIRSAVDITADAFKNAMRITRAGSNERVVRAELEALAIRRGVETAFVPIVTVEGEVLHKEKSYNQLSEGDLLLVDFGVESAEGYASDVTRTWPVTGQFSPTQLEIYNVVLNAQKACIDAIKPGASFKDIHLIAGRTILEGLKDLKIIKGGIDGLMEKGAYALFFPHGVGHLIGLDVHDMEDLGEMVGYNREVKRSNEFGLSNLRFARELEETMVVTIEPGIYFIDSIIKDENILRPFKRNIDTDRLAEFKDIRGIRIEDTVLVTNSGRNILSKEIPKEIDDLAAAIGPA